MSNNLPFPEDFQLKIAGFLMSDASFARDFLELLQPAYFEDLDVSSVVGMMRQYKAKYGDHPDKATLMAYYSVIERDPAKQIKFEDRVDKVLEMDVRSGLDFAREQIRDFLVLSAMKTTLFEVADDIAEGKVDKAMIRKFQDALSVGSGAVDLGTVFKEVYRKLIQNEVDPSHQTFVQTGLPHLDACLNGGLRPGELGIVLAPPKGFKCSKKNTPVMMFDGSIKMVQDVVVGDLLMGDDSRPRRVLEVGRGTGEMYSVEQSNGDDYTVTAEHILCLKRPPGSAPSTAYGKNRYHGGDFLEMTVAEYHQQSTYFKRTWKGYKVGVEFPAAQVPIDPYYIGLWLGDGHNRDTTIFVSDGDQEILDYLHKLSHEWGVGANEYRPTRTNKREHRVAVKALAISLSAPVGSNHNPLTSALRSVGLGGANKKHLPNLYKFNSRETRLRILAGMLDSDGHFRRVKGFIFSNTNRQLCDDACWLARSLGFKSHVVTYTSVCNKSDGTKVHKEAFRTLIQGRVSEIPTKLPRKRGTDSVRVSERTALRVKPVGVGDWYGFKIDGNSRYLMSDFTVTHNSGALLNFGWGANQRGVGASVDYLTLELSEALQNLRYASRVSGLGRADMMADPGKFTRILEKRHRTLLDPRAEFRTKFMAPYVCTPLKIREHLDRQLEAGKKLGVVLIDYLDLMGSDSAKDKDYLEKIIIVTELRQIAIDYKVPIWTAARATREAIGRKRINMAHMSGTIERIAVCDCCYALCHTEEEKLNNRMRIVPVASRNDGGDKIIECKWMPRVMSIRSLEARDITDDDIDDGSPTRKTKGEGKQKAKDALDELVSKSRDKAKTALKGLAE